MVELKKGWRLAASAAAFAVLVLISLLNLDSIVNNSSGAGSSVGAEGGFALRPFLKYIFSLIAAAAVLFVRLRPKRWLHILASWIIFLSGPVLCFEMVRVLVGAQRYAWYIYLDNLVFYVVLQFAVFVLTQSVRISLTASFIISYILHAANQLVLLIRGTPLVPTDLLAIRTAMTVTTPGDWRLDINLLTGTCTLFVLVAVSLGLENGYPRKWVRAAAVLPALAVLVMGCRYIINIDYLSYSTSTFDTESTNNLNGVALSFYINLRKSSFDPPEGYDPAAIEEFLLAYEDEVLADGEELPNIIVIMNESFSDLSYLGKLKTDQPYMEYYNELAKEYPNGRVLVSVLGGGTCNTEFEYLTGLSMMYTPNNCYTYMQHIKQEIPSLASYLDGYGYETVAMHPFYEVCWKRNTVYELMGFDDFISGEDMTDYKSRYTSADRWEKGFGDEVEYVRTLISDSYFYKQVIDKFENKAEDRIFIFGVTVQNHSGYEYDGEDFVTDVHIEDYEVSCPRAEQYLSLVKKSDEALRELIEYFEQVDEKTLIVFFGDHQPNVESWLIDYLAPQRKLIVNSFLTRYETPFLIWSNYELDESVKKNQGIISANYLALRTLECAGVPLSREWQMIKDAQEVATAMNTWGYFDKTVSWNERKDTYRDEILNIYNFYTYYTMTGGES